MTVQCSMRNRGSLPRRFTLEPFVNAQHDVDGDVAVRMDAELPACVVGRGALVELLGSSITRIPKSLGRPMYGSDNRAVRSEIDPSHVIFIAPTRTQSSPCPVRTPGAISPSNVPVPDQAIDADGQLTGVAGILIGAKIVRRAVRVVHGRDAARDSHSEMSRTPAR